MSLYIYLYIFYIKKRTSACDLKCVALCLLSTTINLIYTSCLENQHRTYGSYSVFYLPFLLSKIYFWTHDIWNEKSEKNIWKKNTTHRRMNDAEEKKIVQTMIENEYQWNNKKKFHTADSIHSEIICEINKVR